jgi:hypothetical protein
MRPMRVDSTISDVSMSISSPDLVILRNGVRNVFMSIALILKGSTSNKLSFITLSCYSKKIFFRKNHYEY